MLAALEPFTQYITYLAKGKLDEYFNSIRPEDLVTDLKVELATQPMLLLRDLGASTQTGRRLNVCLFAIQCVCRFSLVVFVVDD